MKCIGRVALWAALVMVMGLALSPSACAQVNPPRKVQSYGYTGPITLSGYQRFQFVREQLEKEGVHIASPTGN